jgi:protein ImuB
MRLECRLTCQGGKTLEMNVGLFRPTAWVNHLLQLLEVRLESLRLPGAVEAIHLSTVSAPLELRQQEMFAEKTRAEPYHLSGLIDRLSNRLGHTRVARVRLVPEAQPELSCHYAPLVGARSTGFSRNRINFPLKHRMRNNIPPKGGTTSARPLRLLNDPLRLSDNIDSPFVFAGRQHRIVCRIGPERIETGWWRGHTIARDYYRVETSRGCWYWIFRRLPRGPWFLHGVFE